MIPPPRNNNLGPFFRSAANPTIGPDTPIIKALTVNTALMAVLDHPKSSDINGMKTPKPILPIPNPTTLPRNTISTIHQPWKIGITGWNLEVVRNLISGQYTRVKGQDKRYPGSYSVQETVLTKGNES